MILSNDPYIIHSMNQLSCQYDKKTKITEQTDSYKQCLYHQNDLFSMTTCTLQNQVITLVPIKISEILK